MEGQFEWKSATPESQGIVTSRLDALREALASRNTKAFLVLRNDQIVYEWYVAGHEAGKRHYTASLAKAIVGGTSLLLALGDGRLSLDDPATCYVPQWQNHPRKSRITIRHLATHCSGIEDAELSAEQRRQASQTRSLTDHHMSLPGWKGAFWRQEPDPFTVARDQAPVVFPPGSDYAYSNPGMAVLAYAVTASLRGAPYTDIRTLLRERIALPLGLGQSEWAVGYGKTFRADELPLVANWGGGDWTARAVARMGRLMLRKGDWEGRQLIERRWADAAVKPAGTPLPDRRIDPCAPASGLCWWTNADGAWPSVPRDAFAGAGAGHQLLLVVPSLNLIVVRNGGDLGSPFWAAAVEHLFTPLMAVFAGPCPPSPVISGIEWDPPETILRQCALRGRDGSDNWPVTWGRDNLLYTAYGDGWGFDEPPAPEKLSMGVAALEGAPPAHRGRNIPSNAEQKGMGRAGRKASSLLMVNGVLYMWVRNADEDGAHCQLAWSTDGARTWQWAGWEFEEFGYCIFLNFGRDYEASRDGYVYVYSHDGPSAYEPADRMVLARVPKASIRERAAYEFLMQLETDGRPSWSYNVARRGAVFAHPGRCLRSSVTYNAGLRRYLWWQQLPVEPYADTRFKGGFGVYDAPEPWGPWTTVFYVPSWDVGPGETGCFPAKWMSPDGRTVWLVFSGDDRFSVRRGTLLTGQG